MKELRTGKTNQRKTNGTSDNADKPTGRTKDQEEQETTLQQQRTAGDNNSAENTKDARDSKRRKKAGTKPKRTVAEVTKETEGDGQQSPMETGGDHNRRHNMNEWRAPNRNGKPALHDQLPVLEEAAEHIRQEEEKEFPTKNNDQSSSGQSQ